MSEIDTGYPLRLTLYNCSSYCVGHVPGTDLGPVISAQAKQRVLGLIQSGVDEGATLLLDGRGLTVPGYEKGNFIGPTILTNVKVNYSYPSHINQIIFLAVKQAIEAKSEI